MPFKEEAKIQLDGICQIKITKNKSADKARAIALNGCHLKNNIGTNIIKKGSIAKIVSIFYKILSQFKKYI
ncbi:MAG: hypothetical protein LRZ98_00890 [Candidatus Pacebacteria bacterium]|nr:hypothetical protein [Candidatus Paceibacterota bacterium]